MVEPIVNVHQGKIRGTVTLSDVGGFFISFKGIPYAAPPVGDLRFKDPQPPEPWNGVLDAIQEGPQCAQVDEFSHEIEGGDDCLYLNVATLSLDGRRPVMVWIHGGGFTWGNGGSGIYGLDYLVKLNVVIVSINYRLGVLGFLALDHEAAPGNMGLKDQVAALKWVRQNISEFGGDPNNVTIFGQSAGAGSVHFLLLSPLARGLFHKAIAQSGVALSPWARIFKTAEIGRRLAANLGREATDPNEIVDYLRTIPVRKLIEAQHNVLTEEEKLLYFFAFGPTVDDKSVKPFLPRPARDLAAQAYDVPFILGYNSHEGIVTLVGTSDENLPAIDPYLDSLISRCLVGCSPTSKVEGVKTIRKFYFGDKPVSKEVIEEYVQCIGDAYFVLGIHDLVQIRAKAKSPTYFYRFSHDAPRKLCTYFFNRNAKGAAHSDELVYLFYPNRLSGVRFIESSSPEQEISEKFLRMWTDFAKTGNPTPRLDNVITIKWKPITRTAKNYLEIGAELTAGVNPDEDILQLWNKIRYVADKP